ncbi:MAG: hypothetical protein R6V44_05050 [Paracoccaceae bacterium]
MSDRKRSPERGPDADRDEDRAPGAPPTEETPEETDEGLVGGRAGGRLARQIGTRDELKRAFERPAGVTRVRKSDEREDDRDDKTTRGGG